MIDELLNELSAFPGREADLRKEFRWRNRSPMYYRPHLYTHSKHVAWLLREVMPKVIAAVEGFDERRAYALGLVHDDPEILTGDYPAADKARMTQEQLQTIADEERVAIPKLASRYPKALAGFDYEALLVDMVELKTPEAQVAKYMDRFDGFGEGVHEIYAGNRAFVGEVDSVYGMTPPFGELNIKLRRSMHEKFPLLRALGDAHHFFSLDPLPDLESVCSVGAPHTRDSLFKEFGYPQYDEWLRLVREAGDEEELVNLYTKKE